MLEKFVTVRTTVAVPAELLKRSQRFVDEGSVPSRNALIVTALERFLSELERQEIDRQFELMADDDDYRGQSKHLAEDFAESDWEALTLGEGE